MESTNVYTQTLSHRRHRANARADAPPQLCDIGHAARRRAVRLTCAILARRGARAAWHATGASGARQPAVARPGRRPNGAGDLPGAACLCLAVVVHGRAECTNMELR